MATFRKGHYWLFWIGFFFPLLWIVGALSHPRNAPLPVGHTRPIARDSQRHRRPKIGGLMTTTTRNAARLRGIENAGDRGGAASVGGGAGRARQGRAGGGATIESRRV